MLSWDGVAKAWNVLEWNFSFSIGDGVTFVVAVATTAIAFLTYRIQNEQKRIVEQQNEIIKQQMLIEKVRFKRETEKLKIRLSDSIDKIVTAFIKHEIPDSVHFTSLDENVDELAYLFSIKVAAFAYLLLEYSTIQQKSFVENGVVGKDEKKLGELISKYSEIVEDLYVS